MKKAKTRIPRKQKKRDTVPKKLMRKIEKVLNSEAYKKEFNARFRFYLRYGYAAGPDDILEI